MVITKRQLFRAKKTASVVTVVMTQRIHSPEFTEQHATEGRCCCTRVGPQEN